MNTSYRIAATLFSRNMVCLDALNKGYDDVMIMMMMMMTMTAVTTFTEGTH
jgi:hypothetical protein